jgi:hypothetical protein
VEVEVFKTRVFFFKTSHLSIFSITFFLGDDSRRENGGILEKISKNIGYKFHILIHYRYIVILVGS